MQSIAQKIELELLEPVMVGRELKPVGSKIEVSRNAAKVLIATNKARIWTQERAAESAKPLDAAPAVEYSAQESSEQEPAGAEQETLTGRAAKRIPRNQR